MLLTDESSQWTVTTPFYNIGEHVYKLRLEFKLKHPEIIWNIVSRLRHRLVRDYDGVNWSVIIEVVFGEMDQFIDSEKNLYDKGGLNGVKRMV